jgi:malonyl-CoA O-methyltransferase
MSDERDRDERDRGPVASGYDDWSTSYDSDPNPTRDLDGFVLREHLELFVGRRVLELGSGTGRNSQTLAGVAKPLIGIELSGGMISIARRRLSGFGARLLRADLTTTWPLADACFEASCSNLVLEHLSDLEFFFRELARVLKPGSRHLLSEFHPDRLVDGGARFMRDGETRHLPSFPHSHDDILAAVEASGLRFEGLSQRHGAIDDPIEPPRLLVAMLQKSGGTG